MYFNSTYIRLHAILKKKDSKQVLGDQDWLVPEMDVTIMVYMNRTLLILLLIFAKTNNYGVECFTVNFFYCSIPVDVFTREVPSSCKGEQSVGFN